LLKLLIVIGFVLFFAARLLPRLGHLLGQQARKPFRQAKWMWSWFAGSESDSLQAEHEYGRECAREFAAQFIGKSSSASQELVDAVGVRLADAVRDPRREFRFSVVSSTMFNAFALPGGFVFVTEPLLDLCDGDPDEIAFFLGHEIGHILRGHAKDKLTASTFLNAVGARLPGAGPMLRQILNKGYSRELELEADREGVRLARASGFDPHAAVRALSRLAQISTDSTGVIEYFSSHPPVSERVREIERCV
jgi:beta-barrel assembly-enhancing protease